MKKIVLILLMSLLFTAFAATLLDTAEITLTAIVQGVHEIGIFTSKVTSNAVFAAGTDISTEIIPEIDPASTATISTSTAPKYLAVRTNQKAATTLSISIRQLSSTDSDKLDYSMVFGNDSTLGTGAGNYVVNEDKTHTITIPAGNGLRLYNFPFHFELTPEQFRSAVPTSYSATITFTYTAP